MDIIEYVNSGVIEDYCLGLLSPEEMKEVAKNALKYEEVMLAIETSERVLKSTRKNWERIPGCKVQIRICEIDHFR